MEAPHIDSNASSKPIQPLLIEEEVSAVAPPAYTPHAPVKMVLVPEEAATTSASAMILSGNAAANATDGTPAKKKKHDIFTRVLMAAIVLFWTTVFIGGIFGTVLAFCNTTYTFTGSMLWATYTGNARYGVIAHITNPTTLLYLKISGFGAGITGFVLASVVVLPLLPFRNKLKTLKKKFRERRANRCNRQKKVKPLKTVAINLATFVISPPLTAFVGLKTLPLAFGPQALMTAEGETADVTRALLLPLLGAVFSKVVHVLFVKIKSLCRRSKGGSEDVEETEGGDELPVVNVATERDNVAGPSAAQVTEDGHGYPVDKPLIEV